MAIEYTWLFSLRHGMTAVEIARRGHLNVARVRRGIARARQYESTRPEPPDVITSLRKCRLVPLFPIGPFTPQSVCAHKGPIRPGSLFVCMVCHQSGYDGHPAMQSGSENISMKSYTSSTT